MTSTENLYSTPEADVSGEKPKLVASFGTLNFWRKAYLVLMWFGTACILLGVGAILTLPELDDTFNMGIEFFIMFLLIAGISLWTHIAIVKRLNGQIVALAIINLFPLLNLIGLLIMLSILRVTKKEREAFNLVKS